jgi:hypothetical protein
MNLSATDDFSGAARSPSRRPMAILGIRCWQSNVLVNYIDIKNLYERVLHLNPAEAFSRTQCHAILRGSGFGKEHRNKCYAS